MKKFFDVLCVVFQNLLFKYFCVFVGCVSLGFWVEEHLKVTLRDGFDLALSFFLVFIVLIHHEKC